MDNQPQVKVRITYPVNMNSLHSKFNCRERYFTVTVVRVICNLRVTMAEKIIKNVVIVVILELKPNGRKWDVDLPLFSVSLVKKHFQVVV